MSTGSTWSWYEWLEFKVKPMSFGICYTQKWTIKPLDFSKKFSEHFSRKLQKQKIVVRASVSCCRCSHGGSASCPAETSRSRMNSPSLAARAAGFGAGGVQCPGFQETSKANFCCASEHSVTAGQPPPPKREGEAPAAPQLRASGANCLIWQREL